MRSHISPSIWQSCEDLRMNRRLRNLLITEAIQWLTGDGLKAIGGMAEHADI
jgi:hypothetical protein